MPKLTRTKRSKRILPKTKRSIPKTKRSRTRIKIRQQRGGWPWSKKVEVAEVAAATEADEADEAVAAEKKAAEKIAAENKRLEEQAKNDARREEEEQAKSNARWKHYHDRKRAAQQRRDAAYKAYQDIAKRYNDYENVEKYYKRKPISRWEWELRDYAAQVAPFLASSWSKEPPKSEIEKVNKAQRAEEARKLNAFQMENFNMTPEQYGPFVKKNDETLKEERSNGNYGVMAWREIPM